MAKFRHGTLADLDELLVMGQAFVDEFVPDLRYSPERTRETLTFLLQPGNLLLVVEGPDHLRAAAGLAIVPHPLTDDTVASELFWYVRPEHRGKSGCGVPLLQGAMGTAKARGVTKFHMVALASNPSVEALYLKLGFRRRETSYELDL